MLAEIQNDLLYLLNILESIEKIKIYSDETGTAEDFYYANDQINFNATLNLLANIGENVKKISVQLKEKKPDVQWQDITDFRNKAVHDYMGLDIYIVFRIIKSDLEPLKKKIFKIISEEIKNNNFNEQELELAKGSFYYRHIPFDRIKEKKGKKKADQFLHPDSTGTRKCPECKGIIKPGETELNYELETISVTVRNVPASVCTKCGRSFIDGHITEDVNRLVNRITEDLNSFTKTHPQIGERRREVAIAV